MSVTRFALVTAFGAVLWIGSIFAIAKVLGSQTLICFCFFQGKIAAIVTALLLAGAFVILRKLSSAVAAGGADPGGACMSATKISRGHRPQLQLPARIRRWAHWEFWPAWLFYIPVVVYYAWLAIRHRRLNVPTSANPGITTGGSIGESKLEILDQLRRTSP